MVVFSSLEAAKREGFEWLEFQTKTEMHVVVKTMTRRDGLKQRALAFAKPSLAEAA